MTLNADGLTTGAVPLPPARGGTGGGAFVDGLLDGVGRAPDELDELLELCCLGASRIGVP